MILVKILIVILTILIISGCSNNSNEQVEKNSNDSQIESSQSFPYPLVKWNNQIYRITTETIEEVESQLGEIEHYSLEENEEKTEDKYSNYFQKGSKVFSIKDEDPNEMIAIEKGENEYVKAVISSQ